MQVEPSFPLGTSGQELFAKKHGLVRGREEYERFRDVPFYGTYFLSKPRLVVKEGIVLGRFKIYKNLCPLPSSSVDCHTAEPVTG